MAEQNRNAHNIMYGAHSQIGGGMMMSGGGMHYPGTMVQPGNQHMVPNHYPQRMGQQMGMGTGMGNTSMPMNMGMNQGMMNQYQQGGARPGYGVVQGMAPGYQQIPMQMMMTQGQPGYVQQQPTPQTGYTPQQPPGQAGYTPQQTGQPSYAPQQTIQTGYAPQQQTGQPSYTPQQQGNAYRPPPPQYTSQMAYNYQVKQGPTSTGQTPQPGVMPAQGHQPGQQQHHQSFQPGQQHAGQAVRPQPAHQQKPGNQKPSGADVARQQQLLATQRRLAELGRQGHKQVDADSMIKAMFGATDNVKKKQELDPGPGGCGDEDDFGDFGDFMSMPADGSPAAEDANLSQPTQPEPSQPEPEPVSTDPSQPKQDLASLMLQCSDLTQPAKAKTFQKPSVKEVKPKVIRQTTFQQSERARRWEGVVTDELHSLFVQPTEPPAPAPSEDLLGDGNANENAVTMATADGSDQPTPANPTLLGNQPSNQTILNGQPSNQAAPLPGNNVVANGVSEGAAPHIPPLYYNTAAMPTVYHMVLEAVTGPGGIETGRLYPILLRSQLPREVLGRIWSLANQTAPGQLTREELFMVLAMVALVQNKVHFDSAEVLRSLNYAPVPNLGQDTNSTDQTGHVTGTRQVAQPGQLPTGQVADPGQLGQPAQQPVYPASAPSVARLANHVPPPLNTEQDDFADFQQANNDGFGEFVSSPKEFDAEETPTPVNDKFTFPGQPVISASPGFTASVSPPPPPTNDIPPPPPPRIEHKIQDLHFEFDPCRGSDSSSMSSYAFDTQSRDSDTTKSDDFDDFHAADSYSSASSIGGAPAVAHDARNDHVIRSSAVTSLPPPSGDKYSFFREVTPQSVETTNETNVDDEFGSFKDAGLDSKVVDIKALVNNPDLYKKPDSIITDSTSTGTENKYDVFRTMETGGRDDVTSVNSSDQWNNEEDSWADFRSALPVEPPVVNTENHVIKEPVKKKEVESSYSPWRQDPKQFTPSSVALADEPPPLSTDDFHDDHHDDDDEFGHFSSAPPDEHVENEENKPSQPSPFFKQQNKGHHELSYGAMHDEPPEMDDDINFDDDFDQHPPPDHDLSPTFPVSSHDTGSLNRSIFDTEPPPLSPVASEFRSFPPSQSDHSLESLTAKISNSMFKEDCQSVASLELPRLGKDMMADSQSVSSAGSIDLRKEDRDGQSVKSLDFQSPSEPPEQPFHTPSSDFPAFISAEFPPSGDFHTPSGEFPPSGNTSMGFPAAGEEVEESFGEFSEAPVIDTNNDESSWVQQPKDAKEFLSGGVLLTDRYSAASQDEQAVEKHVYEWGRCLGRSLDLIQGANTIFMDISNASVCGEVVHSVKGNEYIDNLVAVYRVTCRISMSITSTSAGNQQLAQLLKDIDLGWNNLQGFIANSPVSPVRFDDKTDLKSSVLRADDTSAQEKACGVCLISVDAPGLHKLFYAGRQYHASCANLWLNCVDSTLPTLRLPELL